MKKIKYLVLGIMLTTLVTGCGMKSNVMLDINDKKDVNFQVLIAMDDEMLDTMLSMGETSLDEDEESTEMPEAKTHTDEERWNYLKEGFTSDLSEDQYEKYTEGKFKGYKVSVFKGNIDEVTKDKADEKFNLSLASDINGDEKDNITLFTKKGNNYVANLKFDNSSNEEFSSVNNYSSSMDLFEMKFVVTLPTKAISNNADSVSSDGKTLTWDMTKDAKDINFEFNFNGSKSNNMVMYAIAGGVLAVGIIALVVVVSNNKKKVA